MIDHVGFPVADFARAKAFYAAVLAPLGITLVMEVPASVTGAGSHAGFGTANRSFFWIGDGGPAARGLHIAFSAPTRAAVDAFHQAAIAAGGTDNGAPGLRPHYHPTYYAAFVRDPDGHNIEAVCHAPG